MASKITLFIAYDRVDKLFRQYQVSGVQTKAFCKDYLAKRREDSSLAEGELVYIGKVIEDERVTDDDVKEVTGYKDEEDNY